MWRALIEPALLFAAPFLFYAVAQLLRRRWPFVAAFWSRRIVSTLAVIGLAAAIVGVAMLGLSTRNTGRYVPAHMDESGRLAPGRFE